MTLHQQHDATANWGPAARASHLAIPLTAVRFRDLLRKGVLRGFKHPNVPVAVDLTELAVAAVMTSFRVLPCCVALCRGNHL
jgi:hypothetical protein